MHVELLLALIPARGETRNDILTKLLKEYKAVSDSVFVMCIARKKETHEDGQDLNPTALMHLADNKF